MIKNTFDVYGVSIQVKTSLDRFFQFVSHNYAPFVVPQVSDPDLHVMFSERAGKRAADRKQDFKFFGEGVYVGDHSIYWENDFGFRVLISRSEDETLSVEAFHHDLIGKPDAKDRFKDFQRSMRWAIHFPLFTLLQYNRNWALVHASAVVKDGNAIVFCGLNKVGKSTLAVYLTREYGYDLMTDNFLFVGDGAVYGFPEVVRLSPEAAERMDLDSIWDNLVYGKYHVRPRDLGVTLEGFPKGIFIVNQTDELMTRPLSSEDAWKTMRHLHTLLGEFPEQSYLGFWPYLTGESIDSSVAAETMTDSPWYELSYKPNWELQAVATAVEQCI